MIDKDRYFFLEALLTFVILCLVISLFGEALAVYGVFLVVSLAIGLCFSWLLRDRENRIIGLLVTTFAFAILVWIIYSILNIIIERITT